jgi:hypothetical protein
MNPIDLAIFIGVDGDAMAYVGVEDNLDLIEAELLKIILGDVSIPQLDEIPLERGIIVHIPTGKILREVLPC